MPGTTVELDDEELRMLLEWALVTEIATGLTPRERGLTRRLEERLNRRTHAQLHGAHRSPHARP